MRRWSQYLHCADIQGNLLTLSEPGVCTKSRDFPRPLSVLMFRHLNILSDGVNYQMTPFRLTAYKWGSLVHTGFCHQVLNVFCSFVQLTLSSLYHSNHLNIGTVRSYEGFSMIFTFHFIYTLLISYSCCSMVITTNMLGPIFQLISNDKLTENGLWWPTDEQ